LRRLDALATGIVISLVSAWYSILGLMTIFSGAQVPILIMGTVLEAGKVITASWLYRNWKHIPIVMRAYFSAAVIVLMVITSIGIFGYLSSAHVSASIETGDARARVASMDSEIAAGQVAEAAATRQIRQLDAAVDKLIELDQVTKSMQLRQQQAKDREALRAEIKRAQDAASALRMERAQEETSIRRAEAEAGPVKYVAEIMYGESSKDSMDRAVRFIIVLLMFAFDPLAILLIMAASYKTSPENSKLETAAKFDSTGRVQGSSDVFVPIKKRMKRRFIG